MVENATIRATAITIRLLIKKGDKIEDVSDDIDPDEFGGFIPAIGDRVVFHRKPHNDYYRVIERIFDSGFSHDSYVGLVVEEISGSDLDRLGRFM